MNNVDFQKVKELKKYSHDLWRQEFSDSMDLADGGKIVFLDKEHWIIRYIQRSNNVDDFNRMIQAFFKMLKVRKEFIKKRTPYQEHKYTWFNHEFVFSSEYFSGRAQGDDENKNICISLKTFI